jgi:acyl transferase domain-containing protein
VNQDGKTETITTPSEEAQKALIQACYRRAGLDPAQTAYFEAHGTGTPTGDPIEARAIASVFQDNRAPDQPLRIGSVKANIGHTETASGAAAVIKVALALEKGQIPPAANFKRPNPKLRLDEWNLKVPLELESWPGDDETDIRRASINNFGYGGSNAHVIMESYRPLESTSSSGRYHHMNGNGVATNGNGVVVKNGHAETKGGPLLRKVIVLSAKDEQAAQAMVTNLKDYLLSATSTIKDEEEVSFFNNLAYTLGQRRTRFPWVSAVAADSVADLVAKLEAAKPTRVAADSSSSSNGPRIGFVFTGQGAQWHAMGRELIDAYPVFEAALWEMDAQLKEVGIEWNLIGALHLIYIFICFL